MPRNKIKNIGLLLGSFILLLSCKQNDKAEKARMMSHLLLAKIEKGTALNEFPEERFSREEGRKILNTLRNDCDFKNRKELFYGESYHKNLTGPDQIAFIHEYRLKCEDLWLIIVYNLDKDAELFGFNVEPVKQFNPKVEAVNKSARKFN